LRDFAIRAALIALFKANDIISLSAVVVVALILGAPRAFDYLSRIALEWWDGRPNSKAQYDLSVRRDRAEWIRKNLNA
jgi:hypothetical protein